MYFRVGPFENIPPEASLSTIMKAVFCDNTVLDAVNLWLYNNPGYYHTFRYRTEHGIAQSIDIKSSYQRRVAPTGKTIITQLKRVTLGPDFYDLPYLFRGKRSCDYIDYLDAMQGKVINELSRLEGFRFTYARPIHKQDEWGRMVEVGRIIQYEFFESFEKVAGKTNELMDTNLYSQVPLIPTSLGYDARNLAFMDCTLSALQRITKQGTPENLLNLIKTPSQERVFRGKLKGYTMEEAVRLWYNTNPVNMLRGLEMTLASRLNQPGHDAIIKQADRIIEKVEIKCYSDPNLRKLESIAQECASNGVQLVANKESGISNPHRIEVSNTEVEKSTKEFMSILKRGQPNEIKGYSEAFVTRVTLNGALLAVGTSIPYNIKAVMDQKISFDEAIGNVVKDVSIGSVSSGISALTARGLGRILYLPPAANSIVSMAVAYAANIIASLLYDSLFDSSNDIIQNPPIQVIR